MGFPSHPEQSSAPGQLVSQTQIRSVDLETLDPERIDLEMLSEFVNFLNPTLAIHFPIHFILANCMNDSHGSEDAIQATNRRAYDRMASHDHFLTTPVSAEELAKPMEILDGRGWLGGNIRGWRVLCLAGGGGRQGPLYAAAGAEVTVLDISSAMLERDRWMAHRLGLNLRILQGSMLVLDALANGEFDLVAHPVSTCYVASVQPVFDEVARVLRPGGLYISQHKQPINLQTSLHKVAGHYILETPVGHPAIPVAQGENSFLREPHTIEIAHSLDAILGGICRAGMSIEEFSEPDHTQPDAAPNTMAHRSQYVPPYVRIKARKRSSTSSKSLIL